MNNLSRIMQCKYNSPQMVKYGIILVIDLQCVMIDNLFIASIMNIFFKVRINSKRQEQHLFRLIRILALLKDFLPCG